ncbi:hypothetical protein [uncultured Roseobacter sp.]|uniref:hypothetical protein n=1 Tax=uncultured Roseobacter sp. TaxID=114847 RepID=UPI0026233062|nr:hypothetical protein [uncultured Roseobacter sp.]
MSSAFAFVSPNPVRIDLLSAQMIRFVLHICTSLLRRSDFRSTAGLISRLDEVVGRVGGVL